MNKKIQEFLTVPDLAKMFNVHANTIRNALKCGRIQGFKVGAGKRGSWRVYKSEIERMAAFDAREMIDRIVEKAIKKKLKELNIE